MIDLVRLGDRTDHGGKVTTASKTMCYRGVRVARKGDLVECPLHPDVNPNVILDGDPKISDKGVPIARHGFRTTCGCTLISSVGADT
ncbi:PAAR domain-containing protein [Paraburkholderia tropica]|uniref:PAAR domain-containing protein n=1 Tax=Paraburkholderia tropica TaxID=92647 RepID=UPI000945BED9|nr:PAAR domain-containing protein [Paraburkholderia tropica]QNB15884.1 PAAR domain-containing protein [Paraburkholderia tropica]RQN39322.1 PAAR domain-containing protein [Paraburkholderia tropica]